MGKKMKELVKKCITLLIIISACCSIQSSAWLDYSVGASYYMGGLPYSYFGSSYYNNPGTDYYWNGDGWIFESGYKVPIKRNRKNECCYNKK